MRFARFAAALFFATSLSSAARAQEAPAPLAPPATGNRVRVVLDSANPSVQLLRIDTNWDAGGAHRRSASTASTAVECNAPCGITVDGNAGYTVGGPGIVPSAAFKLPPGPEVHLHVSAPGSLSAGLTGLWMTRLAVFPVTVAAIVLVAVGPSTANNNLYYGAAGLAGLAVTMLAVGIPLFALNRTIVRSDQGIRLGAIRITPHGVVF